MSFKLWQDQQPNQAKIAFNLIIFSIINVQTPSIFLLVLINELLIQTHRFSSFFISRSTD